MSRGTKLWLGAWIVTLFAATIFLFSAIMTLVVSAFGEVPAVLAAINALLVPWGLSAIMLAIVLRRIAGRSIRVGEAARG